MFNMAKIGKRIAELRKANGLTQMGLADALGISFQAVSNWERGNTMPDISKLQELAGILGVSVDELLGGEEKAAIIEKAIDETAVLSIEEFKEVGPLMAPEQVKQRFESTRESESGRKLKLGDLISLAPFLDEDDLGELVQTVVQDGCEIDEIIPLAPFLDEDTLSSIAKQAVKDGLRLSRLVGIVPFIDEDVLGELVQAAVVDVSRIEEIIPLAPFMDEDMLGSIAKQLVRDGASTDRIVGLAPFLDEDDLDDIVSIVIKRGGSVGRLSGLAPFLSSSMLGSLAKAAVEKSDFSGFDSISQIFRDKKKKRDH